MLAGKGSIKPDRQRVSAYQDLHIKRRIVFAQPDKVMAYLNCHREVNLINVLGVTAGNGDM